jgi:putative membrane protein
MSKMIETFVDHSANEHTYLAWVRTAIAVMASGFMVEKFDLFLGLAAPSLACARCRCPARNWSWGAG